MNSDKKKRLIIPVATLMVAIVMMAGVGYAAITTSTFTVENNNIQGGELKVSVDGASTEFFKDVKIPYEVHTTNGNLSYKFDSSYNLVKDKKITIVDNTGLYTKYTINVEVKSNTYDGFEDVPYVFNYKITNVDGTSVTDVTNSTEFEKKGEFKLDITLDMKSGVTPTNPNMFTLDDIKIIVTLTGVA